MKIFLTNIPAFYKINLFNAINEKEKIFVLFVNSKSATRNEDFYDENIKFDYKILSNGFVRKNFQLFRILLKTNYSELIIDGWDTREAWVAAFLSKKQKNSIIVESSILESKTIGVKAFIKRFFLSRITKAYPSGINHKKLLEALNFKGRIKNQGGVGLFNVQEQPPYKGQTEIKNFIYVGRFVEVKNLTFLIQVFNDLPHVTLNIVGFGELESELKAIAKDNIKFLGAVGNKSLPDVYRQNHVLVLPSKSESWGLVVEEALNNGLPVIVSDKVGCKDDLITDETGLVFESDNSEALKNAIVKITDIEFYNKLRRGVSLLDFTKRMQQQVDVFCTE